MNINFKKVFRFKLVMIILWGAVFVHFDDIFLRSIISGNIGFIQIDYYYWKEVQGWFFKWKNSSHFKICREAKGLLNNYVVHRQGNLQVSVE